MLKRYYRVAFAAVALISSAPLMAQDVGLGGEIDAAEKQLDADIKACKPIDLARYDSLAVRANKAYLPLLKKGALTKAGAPIDFDQLASDYNRAKALQERARAAAKDCKPPHDGGTTPIDVETKVEPPPLSPATPSGNYQPSTQTLENSGPDYVLMFRTALARHADAKKRCDGPGMMAARAEMDAAQAAAREILAKEKVLGGKSELLKQMEEQRAAAEAGTVSMCPSLTPALAHMLSEPPRVSSAPIEEASGTPDIVKPPPPGLFKTCSEAVQASPATCGWGAGPSLRAGMDSRLCPQMPAPAYGMAVPPAIGGYGTSAGEGTPEARPDDDRKINLELKYTFDGKTPCPNYQDTRVPQPELPDREVFGRVPTGNIDPDYSPPFDIDISPKEPEPEPPPK